MRPVVIFYLLFAACSLVTTVEGSVAVAVGVGIVVGALICYHHCPRGSSPTGPKPDETLPVIHDCPENIIKNADRNKRGANVDWKTPTATDEGGSGYNTMVMSGHGQGFFPYGNYTIKYTAFDKAGNTDECTFKVSVKELVCNQLQVINGNFLCGHKGYIYGATCTVQCFQGFRLDDGNTITTTTCQEDMTWSTNLTTCQRIPCREVEVDDLVEVAYHDDMRRCTFTCASGYSIKRGNSETLLCMINGEWSGVAPQCVDTEAPRLTCPSNINTRVDTGESFTVVDWAPPSDEEYTELTIQPHLVRGVSEIPVGMHQIQYEATDEAGNTATCSFSIFVADVECDLSYLFTDWTQTVTCSDFNKAGSICQFHCAPGYTMSEETLNKLECLAPTNELTFYSQADGDWSAPKPNCSPVQCEPFEAPMNGLLTPSGNFFHGDFCRIECDDGFEVSGNPYLRCDNGNWDVSPPSCEARTCPTPYVPYQSLILNGKECRRSGTAAVDTICEYGCKSGYFLAGNSSLRCEENGQWFPREPPRCEAITCDTNKIPAPVNGYRDGCRDREVAVGAECTLGCKYGFTGKPNNTLTVTCIEDENSMGGNGLWDHNSTLTCEPVECTPFPSPTNGRISACHKENIYADVNSTQSYGSMCTGACDVGYSPNGTLQRFCTIEGSWDGMPLTCVDTTPPKFQCPFRHTQIAEPLKSEVILHFEWEPEKVIEDSLPWTSSLKRIHMGEVNPIGTRPFKKGQYLLEYSIKDSVGNKAACLFDFVVKVIHCTVIYPPQYGELELVAGNGTCNNAVRGSVCRLTCKEGYHLSNDQDEQDFTCVAEDSDITGGYWNGPSNITCEPNMCDIPEIPDGFISGCPTTQVSYRSICQFTCNIGYQSSADGTSFFVRTCQADGSWSGQNFTCTAVTCPGGFQLDNGAVTPEACMTGEDLPYGKICRFSCKSGYQQNGPFLKRCGRYSYWEGENRNTTCIDKEPPKFTASCPMDIQIFSTLEKVRVKYDDVNATDNAGDDQVTISSLKSPRDTPDNGEMFGEGQYLESYTAQDNAGNIAKCNVYILVLVLRCPELHHPKGGIVTCSGRTKDSTCEFTCIEGFKISGQSHILTCSQTDENSTLAWNYNPPSCIRVQCPTLHHDPIAIKSGCAGRYFSDECHLTCPYGYQSSGDPKSVCQANETWSEDNFTCEEKSCPSIDFGREFVVTPADCGRNPAFEDVCHIRCAEKGHSVYPRSHTYMRCHGDGRWSVNISEAYCRDDEPPRLICPVLVVEHAERGEYSSIVSWNVSVEDNSNDEITAHCEQENGSSYPEGRHHVKCSARDSEGNLGECVFDIYVRVRYCPHLFSPNNGNFSSKCLFHHGSICEVTCNDGYELRGSPTLTCERGNGKMLWKTQHWPRCEVKRCPPIPADIIPEDVGITPSLCTDKKPPIYGLTCQFYCKKYGFRPVGYSEPLICEEDGNWNVDLHSLSFKCEDVRPPIVHNCPDSIFVTLSEGNTQIEVIFQEPDATDNSGEDLLVKRSPPDVTSPYRVSQTTVVTYTFSDRCNNTDVCSFRIEVENDLHPEVEFCPNATTVKATGRDTPVTWDAPIFSDPLGDNDAISQSCNYNSGQDFSWGEHNIMCNARNTKNNRGATCVFTIKVEAPKCERLPDPLNGALSCGDWSFGRFCSQYCHERYDIAPGAFVQPYFLCGSGGQWFPPKVYDCSFSRRTNELRLSSAVQYYSGDCRDPETQRAIKEAFFQMLPSQMDLSASCSESSECTIESLSVTCGRKQRRGKRSISAAKWNYRSSREVVNDHVLLGRQSNDYFLKDSRNHIKQTRARKRKSETVGRKNGNQHSRNVRSVGDFVISVSFDLVVSLNVTENATDYEYEDGVYAAMDSLYYLAEDLEQEAMAGNLVPVIPDLDMFIDGNASFVYEDPVPTCDEGYGIVLTSFKCAPCVAGTYFDMELGDCSVCPIGVYQDTEAQTICEICPPGTTTENEGSQSIDDCLAYCLPGEYSSTGLEPCAKCEIGFYQPLQQQFNCTSCPPGYTTLRKGSSSITDCIELCPPGYWSSDGFQPCHPCAVRYYQANYGQSKCLPCPGTSTTDGEGAISKDYCNMTAVCAEGDCFNDAFCESFIDGPRCTCAAGFTGDRCETNIMDCHDQSCENGGTCVDLVDAFACICSAGYDGDDCSEDIDECASNPCINAVSCVDMVADFACICVEGYTNKTCNEEIRPCESEPCQNGGTCQSQLIQFNCTCFPGYSGDYCEIDIVECHSNPCLNGGTCQDLPNGFQCDCINGYSGVTCEEDIELCNPNPCLNGGLCVEEDDSYLCVCQPGKAGIHCERNATSCDRYPCFNGTCHEVNSSHSETGLDYSCECNAGFSGINCDIPSSKCDSLPCFNNGTCENVHNGFVCHCPLSFTGDYCEEMYNLCDAEPCGNNGICIQNQASFFCICSPEFTGLRCEHQMSLCHEEFCQNGGYCAPTNSSSVCVCPSGFTGLACEKRINMCESQPCLNNGQCIQRNTTYTCQCQEGYTGEHCDVNIDECWTEPCMNGYCEDRINDYYCDCFIGFEGKDCDIEIDDCLDHACVYGECLDGNGTYSCLCQPGYRGRRCQEEVDECGSDPCFHSTNCEDQINAYRCTCEEGWTGDRCEINIDDCYSGICRNGGTCVDHINNITCLCLPGFSGEHCDININECESVPCENGGTCNDMDGGYMCSCQRGWDGENCQIKISMCQPNPCLNGGICNTTDYGDGLSGYTCYCQPGLEGEHCEFDVDDCEENDCVGASTCLDLLNGYRCVCPPGFIGDTCSIEEDPCHATPCLNNGTCNRTPGEDAKIPCLCPIGYEGQYCERNANDCVPNPCLNEGKCEDGFNTFICHCQPGLAGTRCEENINECQYNSCDEIGTLRCQDILDGYYCVCRHGFKGRHCTERISSNFDIVFPKRSKKTYIQLQMPPRELLNFTLSIWVHPEIEEGNILSYELQTGGGISIFMNKIFKLDIARNIINTTETVTKFRWHHIAVTYNYDISTATVYVDGKDTETQHIKLNNASGGGEWNITLGGTYRRMTGVSGLRQFEGRISGVNIWDEVMSSSSISALAENCSVEIPGNVLMLADINVGVDNEGRLDRKSTCEAFNDCASEPCANGATCVDRFQSFECLCPEGLEGPTCLENPDDCEGKNCLNNGTCVDGLGNFTCMCSSGYTGKFCELNIVHGGWSEWSQWSQCTKTCDVGTQTSYRQCNNPRPQNGGSYCIDPSRRTRIQPCNVHPCPRCQRFVPPRNGFVSRISDAFCEDCEQKYQVFCFDGYDFCRAPRYEYICGPATGYKWNHGAANPKLRVPGCTKRSNPRGIQITLEGKYSGDVCTESDNKKEATVLEKINQVSTSNGQRQRCVRNGKCRLWIKTQPCSWSSQSRRVRRQEEQASATVTMKFTQLVNDSLQEYLDTLESEDGSIPSNVEEAFNETATELSEVIQNIVSSSQRGLFKISSDGQLHDMELTNGYAKFVCKEGSVLKYNTTICVPCEPGTYQEEDICVQCDAGTYQPDEGKTRCKACPNEDAEYWTGLGAVEREECFPPLNATP